MAARYHQAAILEMERLLAQREPADPPPAYNLLHTDIYVWFVYPLSNNGNSLLNSVQEAMRALIGLLDQEFPLLVLSDPVGRLYINATLRDANSPMTLQTMYNIFEYLAIDSMLTWADLRNPRGAIDEHLGDLRSAIDNLVNSAALNPPPGYLECSSRYLDAIAVRDGAAVLALLDEQRWRMTLAQVRSGQAAGDNENYLLEVYLRHCRGTAAAIGGTRCAGYASLTGAALLSPAEQQMPDMLRAVLQRLESFEMGILAQLAVQCDLRYLGFLLYYALSQAAEPRPVSLQIWSWLKDQLARLFDCDASTWQRAVMVPRACLLVVDSMPGLAPTRRCARFLAFTEAPSLGCLPSRNIFLAACVSDPVARRRISPDDGIVLDAFRRQLGARCIKIVMCFVDQAMLAGLDAGDRFVTQVLDAIVARQAGPVEEEQRLLVAWCLEDGSPAALLRRYRGVPPDSVFVFGGRRESWRVWRSVLQRLDRIRYTGGLGAPA